MQIRIIFDKDTLDKNLYTGWGVSFLIDNKILFDTGEKGDWLIKNMQNLKVEISRLEAVVISHDHWDHQGGLWQLLKENPKLKVYSCPNFSKGFKDKVRSLGNQLIEIDKFTSINENIYTTGEIGSRYLFTYMPEQSLVLKTQNGLTILTGCAHPGIITIIEKVKQNESLDIYLVLGGFHLMDKLPKSSKSIVEKFKQLEVKKVAPTHCTGKNAIRLFKERYGDGFLEVRVGQIIEI